MFIVESMGWLWLILYALGAVVAFYAVAALTIFFLARFVRDQPDETPSGGNTPSRPDPPHFAEWREKLVTEADVLMAARVLVDQHGAAAALYAERNAKLALGGRDREVWLQIKREIADGRIGPREARVLPGQG